MAQLTLDNRVRPRRGAASPPPQPARVPATSASHPLLGIALMAGCMSFFPLMDAVSKLLQDRLHVQNRCLYCVKSFPDYPTLRLHMRKKKHLRIDENDKSFDKFYLKSSSRSEQQVRAQNSC